MAPLLFPAIFYLRPKRRRRRKKERRSGRGKIDQTDIYQAIGFYYQNNYWSFLCVLTHTYVDDFGRDTAWDCLFISWATLMHYWHRRQLDIAWSAFFSLSVSLSPSLSDVCALLLPHFFSCYHCLVLFPSNITHQSIITLSSWRFFSLLCISSIN